ncbi:MAG: riboflavin synthase [Puniceicoccaceae bacterium 5H]|nr:MAG: riboflavin synthase [Puniceicoccaceae bacterium 5H]
MFSGIVEETGRVLAVETRGDGLRLQLAAQSVLADLEAGDSIAVNGCCLTAVEWTAQDVTFDVLAETARVTNLGALAVGDEVNLERSLRYQEKVGGHLVTGHIDGVGRVQVFEQQGGTDYLLEIEPPTQFLRYLVYKGCVAVNGCSLTVVDVKASTFTIWLIPHTLDVTNLRHFKPGTPVNLEVDLMAKYAERLLQAQQVAPATGQSRIHT